MLVERKNRRVIRKAFFSLAFLLLGGFLLAGTFFISGAAQAQTDLGLNEAAQIGLPASDPRMIIARVVQVALGFLGLVALVLIIYAGFVMMTSEGNEEKVEKAKAILKNAVIGLIIILSAFAIVSFIINSFLGGKGGGGGGGGGKGGGGGISGLGNGIIRNVYPEPGQKDVARNTAIVVTFREKMDARTICDRTTTVNEDGKDVIKCAPDAKVKFKNIRIFETNRKDSCVNDNNCDTNIKDAAAASRDNETFIFIPTMPLGSAAGNILHSVKLSTDLKKADGKDAFLGVSNGFEWSFEVSSNVDTTPPQVLRQGGVFPAPDNDRDIRIEGAAAAAQGRITVNAIPQYHADAGYTTPVKNPAAAIWPDAKLQGKYSCLDNGTIDVAIGENLAASVTSHDSAGHTNVVRGLVSGDNVSDNKISLGCGLELLPTSGKFSAGNAWSFNVMAERTADVLTIGSQSYVFVLGTADATKNQIAIGTNNANTAQRIAAALSNDSEVSATSNSNIITLNARKFGTSGNNIELSANNSNTFSFNAMQGGADITVSSIKKSRSDKPMNSVIQVNFNEPVNPATLSGKASDVAGAIRVVNAETSGAAGASCANDSNCQSYKCDLTTRRCVGDYVDGKFVLSNEYRTVEFITNDVCGVNSCGENIYCLPKNSHLKVNLIAASLANCSSNENCKTGYFNTCQNYCSNDKTKACSSTAQCANGAACGGGICVDSNQKKSPLSAAQLSGVADMALNSFDGNRNSPLPPQTGFSEGSQSQSGHPAFNENSLLGICGSSDPSKPDSICTSYTLNRLECANKVFCVGAIKEADLQSSQGDDFTWSFFINDTLDLTSPVINRMVPNFGEKNADVTNPVQIDFSKLMLSASLATGKNVITNQEKQEIAHQLINLKSYSMSIGYWVTKTDQDDQPTAAGDGEADWTQAQVNHSAFSQPDKYRSQVGSGVKDIYQNCYLPSSSQSCSGSPSCCDNSTTAAEKCPNSIFN